MLLAGCYTLEPARRSAPEPGSVIALDITDQGRVALGGLIGPALSQVEGRVISTDSSEYVLGVTGVRFLAGGEQVWHGETVHIKSEYVGSRYERRFSAGRTAALGAVAVGAVVLVAAKGLRVLGQGTTDKTPGDTAQTQRVPRRP
jgi:hypothetical protein